MKPRFSPSCDHSCVKMADRFQSMSLFITNKLGDRMIKHLLNSVIAKYRGFSVCRRSIVCLSLRLRRISDLLPTEPHSLLDRMERNECSPKKTCALIHCADFPCNVLNYNSLEMLQICNNCCFGFPNYFTRVKFSSS